MITAVTGYVELPDHPRPVEEYRRLGQQLASVGVSLLIIETDLKDCWLYKYLNGQKERYFTHSVADNPQKNTVGYHCVQAQKTEWLAGALEVLNLFTLPEVLVWIDFGVFALPGVNSEVIREFMERAQSEQAIAIPGCWDRNYVYDDQWPCWRFCGGVFVVPRSYVTLFDAAMKGEYKRWLWETGNISWEVNTMARLEKNFPQLPIWHYKANHDVSIFKNYWSSRGGIQ